LSDTWLVDVDSGFGVCLVAPADPRARAFTIDLADDYLGVIGGIVGGRVDTMVLDDGLSLWFREDARSAGLPRNVSATLLAGDQIHGDAVVTAFDIDDVGSLALSAAQVESLSGLLDPRP
jgi:hypothetical protein